MLTRRTIAAAIIIIATITAALVLAPSPAAEPVSAEPQPPTPTAAPTTTIINGVGYTEAQVEQIKAWVAAVERHERAVAMDRLGALKRNILSLPGGGLDRYLTEIRSLAVQIDRVGLSRRALDRIRHIEAAYDSAVRRVWANIVRLAEWHRAEQAKKAAAAAAKGGVLVHGIVVCNGTTLPSCAIVRRESGFSPTAKNPRSSASGLYQFINSTWRTCGTGYPTAMSAPVSVQVGCAKRIWNNGRGASHWALR